MTAHSEVQTNETKSARRKEKLTQFGDSAFRGDSAGQLLSHAGFPPARLIPITDVTSAGKAIDVIVHEGEGTTKTLLDGGGQVAHYYRFEQIARGKELVPDSTAPQGFSFTGAPVPFDADGVFPITANQRLAELDPNTEAGKLAKQFAQTLTEMLTALHKTFAGEPNAFAGARGLMFDLESTGMQLCATPVQVDGQPTEQNAGPPWELVIASC